MQLKVLKSSVFVAALAVGLLCTGNAHAALIGFVENPTENSALWAGHLGGDINADITFDAGSLHAAHPTGALDGAFYGDLGVALSLAGEPSTAPTVVFGEGPGDVGLSGIQSPGEGGHAASNYLDFESGDAHTLTLAFADPVLGVGLDVIDLFGLTSTVTIEAFDAQGHSLGAFNSLALNFQNVDIDPGPEVDRRLNNVYFMGLASGEANISSFTFTADGNDNVGVDDIVFAPAGTGFTSTASDENQATSQRVPEPASLGLLGAGLTLLALTRARARKSRRRG